MDSRNIRPLVLIVDDDAQSAKLLARLLRGDGYEAEVTTDGAAALGRLTRDPIPDVLLTDFHLPHADGLAIGKYARSRRAGLPIFIVTGDPESVANALASDPLTAPTILVTKPLIYAELLVQLTVALGAGAAV